MNTQTAPTPSAITVNDPYLVALVFVHQAAAALQAAPDQWAAAEARADLDAALQLVDDQANGGRSTLSDLYKAVAQIRRDR